MFGSHNIRQESKKHVNLGKHVAKSIVGGTGTSGKASLASEAEGWAKEKNLNLIVQPSYDAVAKLNELIEQGKKVAALIHITC